ncbi:SDR family NAD(P)-dependent oxidoreductase [Bartonella sp. LJL80]
MEIDLTGQVALVTGAAQGIGFHIAETLARAGATTVITDINDQKGQTALEKLKAINERCDFIACDVSSDEQTSSLITTTITRYQKLDILVNNAGIISKGNVTDITVQEWDRLFAINVRSVFLMTRKALPYMMDRKFGRIVNIASVAGQVGGGFLGNSCYGATKGAIISFTKGIAREAGPFNVTTNVICPGMIDTEITRAMSDKDRENSVAGIPLHKAAQPEEIANGVLFLSSHLADYINGVTLNIDGGLVRY